MLWDCGTGGTDIANVQRRCKSQRVNELLASKDKTLRGNQLKTPQIAS